MRYVGDSHMRCVFFLIAKVANITVIRLLPRANPTQIALLAMINRPHLPVFKHVTNASKVRAKEIAAVFTDRCRFVYRLAAIAFY